MIVLKICAILSVLLPTVSTMDLKEFHNARTRLQHRRLRNVYGVEIPLASDIEVKVNKILLKLKKEELSAGTYPPVWEAKKTKPVIEQSQIFHIIRTMPKGAALSVEETGMLSDAPWLVKKLTYQDGCKMCRNGDKILAFSFDLKPQKIANCQWVDVHDARGKAKSTDDFNLNIIKHFTLDIGAEQYTSDEGKEETRLKKEHARKLVRQLISTEHNLRDYYYQSLTQYTNDYVSYVEMRVDDMALDMEQQEKRVRIFSEVVEQVKEEHYNFLGAKIIKYNSKTIDASTMEQCLKTTMELKAKFPKVIAGYDLSSWEESDVPEIRNEYLKILLKPSQSDVVSDLHYFYKAKPSDFSKPEIDSSLVDALLLNSTRIRNGYSVSAQFGLSVAVKNKRIGLEVYPISDQVNGLVSTPQNHPVSILLANKLPVVVCADQPLLLRTLPLSVDFYYLFMANTDKNTDLRAMKRLAMNSIEASAATYWEKTVTMDLFERQWEMFVENVWQEFWYYEKYVVDSPLDNERFMSDAGRRQRIGGEDLL